MLTTPKTAFIVIVFGFSIYFLFYFLSISVGQRHVITLFPKIKHVHMPVVHLQNDVNHTEHEVPDYFRVYYDPYDLYF